MKKSNMGLYGLETPERVIAEFLTAWQDKDYKSMQANCQLTWLKTEPEAEEWLIDYFSPKKLLTFKIKQSRKVSDMFTVVIATTEVRIDNRKLTEELQINVIRESAPYNPCINGKWGVNPISALKVIRRK